MPTAFSQGGDTESRFAHLLQPIRDLGKNWNIDIASDLEDYLEELEKISVTFDGGASLMNFAEAALVVQGSACVYSKKVEYLYTLVYQVLDLLACKKKQQQASVDTEGQDKDVTFSREKDQDDAFISMDDFKGKDYFMKPEVDSPDATVECLPRMPLMLIPLDTAEKKDRPLLSRTGEVLADCSDFKMNSSCLHNNGCMLLDMSYLKHLHQSLVMLEQLCMPQSNMQNGPVREKRVMFMDEAAAASPVLGDAAEDMAPDAGFIPLNDASGDDNNDIGFEPDSYEPGAPVPEQKGAMVVRRSERRKGAVDKTAPLVPYIDPWQQELDPHQADPSSHKPFKRGRTYRLLPKLDNQATKKRKRGKQVETVKNIPLSEFVATAFVSRSKLPGNPLKAPSFPEFEDLYWAEHKRRQALRRLSAVHLGRCEEVPEEVDDVAQMEEPDIPDTAGDDYDDDNDDQGPAMFDMPDVPDTLGLLLNGADDLPRDRLGDLEDMDIPSSYEDLVRVMVDKFMASAQEFAQVSELSRKVAEWEDKIMPKLHDAEERGSFDIHRYEGRIIDSFTEDPELPWVAFQRLASGRPQYEVSRLFLATLQLANNYNVQIKTEGTGDASMDTMQIKLLSRRRHEEELEEYQAPSLQ